MQADPDKEMFRYFFKRSKMFFIHFRGEDKTSMKDIEEHMKVGDGYVY